MTRQRMGGFVRKLLALLFPRRCPVCDDVAPWGHTICPRCIGKFKKLEEPWCMRCGKKLIQEGEYCGDCMRVNHVFERARSLYEYDSVAAAVYRFKYSGRQEYADYFGEEISRELGDFIKRTEAQVLIPVPLHTKRQKKRGYNQAMLLAKAVSRRTGVPVCDNLVTRVKNTKPLKQQNPKERQNNLKKAFNIAENDVKLKSTIIIDDIYTTGSTIDEMARVLKAHGVERVYAITLSCGVGV